MLSVQLPSKDDFSMVVLKESGFTFSAETLSACSNANSSSQLRSQNTEFERCRHRLGVSTVTSICTSQLPLHRLRLTDTLASFLAVQCRVISVIAFRSAVRLQRTRVPRCEKWNMYRRKKGDDNLNDQDPTPSDVK